MPYKPTDWKNKVYDDDGNVLQEGTPLHADNLNNMEQGISKNDEEISRLKSNAADRDIRISDNEKKLKSHDNQIEVLNDFKDEKGKPGGLATLGQDGIVPSSQLPSNLKEIRVAATLAERDAIEKFEGLRVLVTDASDDPTVNSGWAEYVWDGIAFIKTAEAESLDMVTKWGNVTEKPEVFPPEQHQHTESDITDLDKYTKKQVDDRLKGKSDVGHSHTESDITDLDKYSRQEIDNKLADKADKDELHSHSNKATLDKLTDGHLNKIDRNEQRIESLEEDSSKLHSHANKSTLDKLTYSGSRQTLDLIQLDELRNHTHDYNTLENRPSIPSKTSDLTNDSEYVQSNAGRIHVSYDDSDIPPLEPNDIVIKVL